MFDIHSTHTLILIPTHIQNGKNCVSIHKRDKSEGEVCVCVWGEENVFAPVQDASVKVNLTFSHSFI